MKITFTKHGIKADGAYTKCYYGFEGEDIWVRARDYKMLPRELGEIIDGSDAMTDYFENERVKITKNSPFYKAVLKAAIAQGIYFCQRSIAYCEKCGGMLDRIESYRKEIARLEKLAA